VNTIIVIKYLREAELKHSRIAMLAVVGAFTGKFHLTIPGYTSDIGIYLSIYIYICLFWNVYMYTYTSAILNYLQSELQHIYIYSYSGKFHLTIAGYSLDIGAWKEYYISVCIYIDKDILPLWDTSWPISYYISTNVYMFSHKYKEYWVFLRWNIQSRFCNPLPVVIFTN
jgi:hypothetical protein